MLSTFINRVSVSGLAATLVGNGIGRFAFIALIPALIQAGWFTDREASLLTVANLMGYVLGAWMSEKIAKRCNAGTTIRTAMLLCSLSFFACAVSGAGMAWYLCWRTLAGMCGALLMVMPAPLVLLQHQPAVRGRASGMVFCGVGLGAVLAGALVPMLVTGIGLGVVFGQTQTWVLSLRGVTGAWLGMGGICLLLTALSWKQWPSEPAGSNPHDYVTPSRRQRTDVRLIAIAHGLNAVGYLAHTMFWVDYIVRELHRPLATGGFFWSIFGAGAAIGPMLTGLAADRFGLKRCLLSGLGCKALAAALPLLSHSGPALFVSSLSMGMLTPGLVSLVSAYALERAGTRGHRQAWGTATFTFSVAQALGGFAMALLAAQLDSYRPLFLISALALIGAVATIAAIPVHKEATDNPARADHGDEHLEAARLQ
jgi:MFS family permease